MMCFQKRYKGFPLISTAFTVLLVFASSACTTKSDVSLPAQTSPSFSESGTEALPELWWTAFDDPNLKMYVAKGLENNFSLASSWERLRAARALARRESSDLYPDLNLGAAAQRQIDDGDRQNTFEFGPEASYEADLWGRIRSAAQAEQLRAEASEEAYRTAAISLSADIALTWVRLVETHNQLDLLARQIETNEKVLDVLKARFGVGQARREDILRQRLLIEAIREDVLVFESQIETLEHQLAILQGEAPQGKSYRVAESLPALPPRPDAGLPSELIQRRPDVRRAYMEIKAADKDLAAAIRDQYPRLTLSASYVSEATRAENLFSNWLTTFGAALLAPVFDGGRRQAEIDRREAVREQLVSDYGQTVLEAFREVEDALIREQKQMDRIGNLNSRLEIANATYEQIQTSYFNGANEYIDVLLALFQMQQIERDLLTARGNLIEFRIALYRALAGGFEMPREKATVKETKS
jgi:NodT family efflux transporter outer membrane factor (OMF) lipoprotein